MANSAEELERRILAGLADAQDAYEEFVSIEGWKRRGFESFADWWSGVVVPVMRSLSMRPTREIAAKVAERVRQEEQALPPAMRRREGELAELVGLTRDEIRDRSARSSVVGIPTKDDLGSASGDPLPPEIAEAIERRVDELQAEREEDQAEADAQAELDAAMSETAVRFRRHFSSAMRRAGEVCTFEPDRVAEVYATDFDASVERSFFASLERFIDKVREARRRQTSGLRVVKGGRAS